MERKRKEAAVKVKSEVRAALEALIGGLLVLAMEENDLAANESGGLADFGAKGRLLRSAVDDATELSAIEEYRQYKPKAVARGKNPPVC